MSNSLDALRAWQEQQLEAYRRAAENPVEPEPGASLVGWKPVVSDALAVHPDQVKEATEDASKKKVPTDFLPDGRPVLTSRSHRKQYMQAYGYYDRAGGYGDAQRGGFKG